MAARWMSIFAAAALFISIGARADEDEKVVVERPAQAEARAAQAWSALLLKRGEAPRELVHELVKTLAAADLGASGTVALSHLGDPARTSSAEIRGAAREELMGRAERGDALADALLLEVQLDDREISAHQALAVKLARARLERALLEKPLPEGGSFEAGDKNEAPPAQTASADAARVAPRSQQAQADLAEVRRSMAAMPAKGAQAALAREISGLAALAAGDELAAETEFGALSGDEGRGQRALLQLARLAYARGDDRRAGLLYARVGRGSSEWLDALFEASWAHFRRGEDERVLGNLLTLQAPFFKGREFPEAYVLQALVLYENCRYADARRALVRLDTGFRPRHDALAAALAAVEGLAQPFEALEPGRAGLSTSLPPFARAELDRAAELPDLVGLRTAVLKLGAELDSFDGRGDTIRSSSFARTVLPEVRALRLRLLGAAGNRLRAHLAADRAELRELLGQSLRLSYEISGRERDQAGNDAARAKARAAKPAEIEDDEVMWPFQGEYWRDELGSYRFTLGTRCQPAPRFKTRTSSAALEK